MLKLCGLNRQKFFDSNTQEHLHNGKVKRAEKPQPFSKAGKKLPARDCLYYNTPTWKFRVQCNRKNQNVVSLL